MFTHKYTSPAWGQIDSGRLDNYVRNLDELSKITDHDMSQIAVRYGFLQLKSTCVDSPRAALLSFLQRHQYKRIWISIVKRTDVTLSLESNVQSLQGFFPIMWTQFKSFGTQMIRLYRNQRLALQSFVTFSSVGFDSPLFFFPFFASDSLFYKM